MQEKTVFINYLFQLFLFCAVVSIQAQEDVTLRPDMKLDRQYQRLVFIDNYRSVSIYDSLGRKMDSVHTGKVSTDLVSTDLSGNFIINCTGEVEFSRVAIYYSREGKEVWRHDYNFQGDGGFELSPDGKYAVLSVCSAKKFTLLLTSDPKNKLPKPLPSLDPGTSMINQFAGDGSLIIMTRTGMLYRYNCETGTIEDQKALKSPNGTTLTPIGGNIYFNADRTLFSLRLYEANDTKVDKTNWLFAFSATLDTKILTRINEQIYDIKVADTLVLATRLNDSTSKFICSAFNSNTKKESLIDADLGRFNRIGTPFIQDDSLFFYIPGQKNSIRKYDLNKRVLEKGVSHIPFVKENKNNRSKAPFLKIKDN